MLARMCLGAAVLPLLVAGPVRAETVDPRAQWETGVDADVAYGVGLRGRYVGVPRGVLELFVEEASSGVARPGFGLELIRRRGGFEVIVGFEMEGLAPDDGLWLDKGSTPPGEPPDLVEFEGFGWITADLSLVWHTPVHDIVAIRYGAGLGLGIVRGDILRTDTRCSGTSTDTCQPITSPEQGQYQAPEDLPPVFPVVGALVGAQVRPTEELSINLEVGLRTVAYAGLSAGYFF